LTSAAFKKYGQKGMWLSLLALLMLFGIQCNITTHFYVFELKGKATGPSGKALQGPVVVELYHITSSKGILKYPLRFIGKYTLQDPKAFSIKDIEYPEDNGTGLVVYIWNDSNKDGKLCSPDKQEEVSGITEIKEFPKRLVEVDLELKEKCLGPEAMYP